MRSRNAGRIVCLLALCQLSAACSKMEHADPATSRIQGDVHFLGPVSGARVILYDRDATDRPVYEAETVSDEAGHYAFDGLKSTGDHLVVAELAGLPWTDPETGRTGAYGDGVAVRAPVDALALLDDRRVEITPLTTLLAATGDALRAAGAEFPRSDAHTAFNAWLTLDPVATPIGEPRSGDVAARRHRLLLESWSTLAAHAADQAGLQPGTALTAEDLLTALVDDILGPPPPRFDGRGAAGPIVIHRGPGAYPLTDQTLRSSYTEAVRGRLQSPRWTDLHEGDIADLLHSLRCAPAAIFASCEDDGGRDRTPPAIEVTGPLPDHDVAEVITIELKAEDPETGIQTLTLSRITGDDRPPIALEDEDDRPGVVSVTFDTRGFIGQQDLVFEADASNGDGTPATLRFKYRLANLPAGQLSGYVFKGPAHHVAVDAAALRPDGSEVALGQALTDDEGAFTLSVHEWRGPIILRAHGVAGADLQTSGFRDEARGRVLSWDVSQILTTVVPDFDPAAADDRPLIVGPLADLAWARAVGLVAQRGQEPIAAYRDSLDLLATHFGLDNADTILHVRPAPADQAVTPPPNQAARHLLALGCLSRLSLDFAHDLAPDAVDGFTALDLLAAYREDVLLDPWFDGRRGDTPVLVARNGVTRPLGDGLRADLAGACARWLSQPDNPVALPVGLVADQLQQMALDESGLFAQSVAPTPFDDGPPDVVVSVQAHPGGAMNPPGTVQGAPDAVVVHVSGTVDLRVEATDQSGVASLTVRGPDDHPDALVVMDSSSTADPAASTHTSRTGRLNVLGVPDGPLTIGITAVDVLGHMSVASFAVVVDNQPPEIRIEPPATVHERAGRWYTNAQHAEVAIEAHDETGVATTTATLDGVTIGRNGPIDLDFADEGVYHFEVSVADLLGHQTLYVRDIVVDRTPPQLQQVETSYVDEGTLGPDRQLASGHRASLATRGPVTVRKWQDHWSAGDDNSAILRWQVANTNQVGGDNPVTDVTLGVSAQLEDGEWGPAQIVSGDGTYDLELTSQLLGFDPVGSPPPPHTTATLHVEAADFAGNSTSASVQLDVSVIPPPVDVEEVDPPDEPRGAPYNISLDDNSLRLAFDRETAPFALRRIALRNPHSIPIRVRLDRPSTLFLDVGLGVGMLGRTRNAIERDRVYPSGTSLPLPADLERLFVSFVGIEPYESPECWLFRAVSEGLSINTLPNADGIITQDASLSYNFDGACVEPAEVAEGEVATGSSIRMTVETGSAVDEDGKLELSPGTAVTLVAAADPFVAPPELVPLLAHPEATLLGFDVMHYVRDVQGEIVLGRAIDGVLPDRLCTQCFDDDSECAPVCEGLGPWLGYRVQAITDVRLRTWENWDDRQPWEVHTLSEHGDLDVVTAELPPLPTVRLQADVAHWGEE